MTGFLPGDFGALEIECIAPYAGRKGYSEIYFSTFQTLNFQNEVRQQNVDAVYATH